MPHTIAEMRALAEQWMAAWNAGDLGRIMDHYAADVEFEANTVVRRWQKADGKLLGLAELREHFRLGLELVPNLHFELEDMFSAPSGNAVLYRRENGNRVLDVVELDDEGKARRVKAFYAAEQN
jgi:ketosteroid isomerase-like protein